MRKELLTAFAAALCMQTATLIAAEHDKSSDKSAKHDQKQSGADDYAHMDAATRDKKFVMDAAKGGKMEVAMGKLALERGQSQAIKDLGQKLVDDHSKANEELKAIATKKGLELPADTHDQGQGHSMTKLATLSGAEFDKAFAKHAVEDHQKDIKKFEKQSQKSQDTELKAFAEKCLPKLREHLAMAQRIPGGELSGQTVNEAAGASTTLDTIESHQSPDKSKDKQDKRTPQ